MVNKAFILKNPYLVIKSREQIRQVYEKRNFRIGEDIVPFFVTANLITEKQMTNLNSKIDTMTNITNKVINAYLNKCMFENVFNFSEKEKEVMKIERGYETVNLFNRYDLFFYGDSFKVIEINADSPGFVAQLGLTDTIYLESVFFSEFKKKNKIRKLPDMKKTLLKSLIKTYNEFGGRKKRPSIALVDWHNVKTMYDQYYTQEYFQSEGYPTFVCQPPDLKYKNKKLAYKGKKIDIIYRRFLSQDYLKEPKKFRPILNALKDKAVCMVNPFVSTIVNDKSFLSKLAAGRFDKILTEKEKEVVKEVIPWSIELNDITVKMYQGRKGMKNYIIKNKNKLVLKPAADYGGNDVFVGDVTDKKTWEKATNKALKEKKWVVQELLDIPEIEVPIIDKKVKFENRYLNLCPYVIEGKVAGFLTRVSASKIINICKGGGVIPTFVR